MGLDIAVGLLSSVIAEGSSDEIALFSSTFENLNTVLIDAGEEPHNEPKTLEVEPPFEAQMWGYGGLHRVRRLAAYQHFENALPPPSDRDDALNDDPVLKQFYVELDRQMNQRGRGLFGGLFRRASPLLPFQHLMMHSDAEGFYLPRSMNRVIFDVNQPQLEGVGGMVGSAESLLEECRFLARRINLPMDFDPQSEEIWEAADLGNGPGELWHQYGVESFCLTVLMRACEVSLETEAAVAFC